MSGKLVLSGLNAFQILRNLFYYACVVYSQDSWIVMVRAYLQGYESLSKPAQGIMAVILKGMGLNCTRKFIVTSDSESYVELNLTFAKQVKLDSCCPVTEIGNQYSMVGWMLHKFTSVILCNTSGQVSHFVRWYSLVGVGSGWNASLTCWRLYTSLWLNFGYGLHLTEPVQSGKFSLLSLSKPALFNHKPVSRVTWVTGLPLMVSVPAGMSWPWRCILLADRATLLCRRWNCGGLTVMVIRHFTKSPLQYHSWISRSPTSRNASGSVQWSWYRSLFQDHPVCV